jgi:hypothetical protein
MGHRGRLDTTDREELVRWAFDNHKELVSKEADVALFALYHVPEDEDEDEECPGSFGNDE